MTVAERLHAIAQALPSSDSSVTLTRSDLLALVEGSEVAPTSATRGLTFEEVAEEVGRARFTVRGWLIAGDLRGYKLNGRDWRVPASALRDHLDQQAKPAEQESRPEAARVDIRAWRRVREGG